MSYSLVLKTQRSTISLLISRGWNTLATVNSPCPILTLKLIAILGVAYAYESGGYEATLLKAPDYLPDLSNPSAYLEGVVFPVALFPKHGHTFGFIYFSPETDDSPQHSSKDNSEGSTAEPVTLDDCYMRLMIELCGRRFMPQTVILSPKLLEADKLTTWIGKTKPRQTAAKHGADFKTFTGDTMVANEIIASLLAKYEGLKEKEYMKIQWEMWMRKSPLSETGFWKYYSKAWVAPNDDPDPVKNKNRLTELEEELLTK